MFRRSLHQPGATAEDTAERKKGELLSVPQPVQRLWPCFTALRSSLRKDQLAWREAHIVAFMQLGGVRP